MRGRIKKLSRKRLAVYAALIIFALIALRCDIAVSCYEIKTDKVKGSTRLVLLTDLHSSYYGSGEKELIAKIEELEPDYILLGGDIADDKVPHERTWQLLEAIGKKYHCYYVSGNHEYWSGEMGAIKDKISSYGVEVLEGESIDLGDNICLTGIDDPEKYGSFDISEEWTQELEQLDSSISGSAFNVLLSHRPEAYEYYKNTDFELVLAGHAHGGQWRIPFILNGLYAPNQGLFPKFAGGSYDLDLGGGKMLVSRGLCRDLKPRVFNRPEIVVADIKPVQ